MPQQQDGNSLKEKEVRPAQAVNDAVDSTGVVPEEWTKNVVCTTCGPMFVHPKLPVKKMTSWCFWCESPSKPSRTPMVSCLWKNKEGVIRRCTHMLGLAPHHRTICKKNHRYQPGHRHCRDFRPGVTTLETPGIYVPPGSKQAKTILKQTSMVKR